MKSNKTHTFFSRLIILFFLAVIAAWGGWFWWRYSIAPIDPTDTTPVMFVVSRDEVAKVIAADLEAKALIHSKTSFYLLVKLLGIEKDLQYGDFRLNKSMDARTIALTMTHGVLDVWVTTLEGWRDEEMATQFAKDLDIPEDQFLQYATEGYMFPDTYNIPRDATGAAVAKMFLDNFNTKVTQVMREDAKKTSLTFAQTITLASIVEREGKTATDRPVIAGILLNRIKLGMPLQVDATLQYALGYQPFEKTWWKKELTDDDKKINSLYNTYTNPGLPPGPISNPGLESIKAAIYPSNTDYLYYLHDKTGAVHYAKTVEDHNANIRKYLQ
ncbi:MAG: endolytic transglycosylase MltG [Candidatus Gottesmanbacteria bacterium]|nr:endolytic transglycosylase MltG [Candidatus Gottesmanbacteria bacterium]